MECLLPPAEAVGPFAFIWGRNNGGGALGVSGLRRLEGVPV